MKSIRRHLNYANVVATLALLFAMSGGALAASHYLLNSTKQINPKVLRALKGKTTTKLVPLAALAPGKAESGDYGLRNTNAGSSGFIGQAVSFAIPLAARIPAGKVEFVDEFHESGAHCDGPGKADPGYLCIYEKESVGIAATPAPIISQYEDHGSHEGAGNFGFSISLPVFGPEPSEWGTFTVAAA